MIKNKFIESFTSSRYYAYYALYLLLIFIAIDNNSNFELALKIGILFTFLVFLNKNELMKISLHFYSLFFINYFLFFILYFSANDESSKIFANMVFTLCLLIFPGYLLVYLMVFLRYRIIFLKNIFFNISIFGTFILPFFGYRSGTINMTYRLLDIFLFLLIIIQLLIILYDYIKDKKLSSLPK